MSPSRAGGEGDFQPSEINKPCFSTLPFLASLGVVSSTRELLVPFWYEGGLEVAKNHLLRGVLAIFDHVPESTFLNHH
jgi:hypothetical protein